MYRVTVLSSRYEGLSTPNSVHNHDLKEDRELRDLWEHPMLPPSLIFYQPWNLLGMLTDLLPLLQQQRIVRTP
ncbi:hypothetical protein M8J77_020426 [Diaphorina citri]|nr:hypothetical protein M8J77_020426 [Diaphorina citri]